jgi:hypothetical protein
VLPTTPMSRLAHVGCSSSCKGNVVFPCLCFVKECGISLSSQRDVDSAIASVFLSPVRKKQIGDGGLGIVTIGPG